VKKRRTRKYEKEENRKYVFLILKRAGQQYALRKSATDKPVCINQVIGWFLRDTPASFAELPQRGVLLNHFTAQKIPDSHFPRGPG
jgi:predicted oxidoreductase (fatty acid repression mutant protein)